MSLERRSLRRNNGIDGNICHNGSNKGDRRIVRRFNRRDYLRDYRRIAAMRIVGPPRMMLDGPVVPGDW